MTWLLPVAWLAGCAAPAGLEPSGATCPPDSPLTYSNFGAPFMTSYCVQCHASTLSENQRQGAPLFHDFDTLEGIVAVWQHVDETTAAGPLRVNTLMPPSDPRPGLAERTSLGEWLACGLPP